MQSHVDSGGMDNIFSAYIDHFLGADETVQLPIGRQKLLSQLESKYAEPAQATPDDNELASA